MSKVLLSFCIPTYNRAEQLFELLKRLIQFQSNEIEIIVSDNASNDKTQDYVKNINDSRINYFRNEKNYGYEANLLLAIKRATGRFVFTLMDDDKIELEVIPWILKAIKTNDKLVQLCGQLADRRPLLKKGEYFTTFKDEYLKAGTKSLLRLLFYYPHSSGVVLRKDVLDLKSALKCIGYYNIGTLFMMEFLIAQAIIAGDTLCTSKTFTYLSSDMYQSNVRKFKRRPYWHPIGRLYISKFKIHIMKYLEKKVKNFNGLKNIFLGWQKNNITWNLAGLSFTSIKDFFRGLSIVLGIKIVSRSPSFWIDLINEIIFFTLRRRLGINYPKLFYKIYKKPKYRSRHRIRSF